MNKKEIIIWGAGKIGRGFLADIFYKAGYELTFVDINKKMVDELNLRGQYTLINRPGVGKEEKAIIDNYKAYSYDEFDDIRYKALNISLIALVVFPAAFDETAKTFATFINERAEQNFDQVLDIIVCANALQPTEKFKELLYRYLTSEGKYYFENKVGLIETLALRIAIEPTAKLKAEDPLVVLTNGYPEMPVDQFGFKGELPKADMLVFSKRIIAEEIRKIYTYNMTHALFAYMGNRKNLTYVLDCTKDAEVRSIAENALNEVSKGLQKEFGFTEDEMIEWNERLMQNMSNPLLKDELVRVGGDPVRKLMHNDRLVGPMLLCKKNGIMPYYIAKATAGAFLFDNPEDAGCTAIKEFVSINGIMESIIEFCGLQNEPEITQLVFNHYIKMIENGDIYEDESSVEVIKKAYELGFSHEKTIKGCAQCTIAALFDLLADEKPILFQAASGLSGGIAITGDGSCGGYTGGVMLMGSYVGRRRDRIQVDGDKQDQYKSYEMAQKLHDKYMDTYGSVTCSDIHETILGKAYCLRTQEVRDQFEEAGAHVDKCTTVIANACAWVADILIEEGYIKI